MCCHYRNMENIEHVSEDQKMLEDIKPDTVSITIIQVNMNT